jgi:hypothetical protein
LDTGILRRRWRGMYVMGRSGKDASPRTNAPDERIGEAD